jgi:hypothetical protein
MQGGPRHGRSGGHGGGDRDSPGSAVSCVSSRDHSLSIPISDNCIGAMPSTSIRSSLASMAGPSRSAVSPGSEFSSSISSWSTLELGSLSWLSSSGLGRRFLACLCRRDFGSAAVLPPSSDDSFCGVRLRSLAGELVLCTAVFERGRAEGSFNPERSIGGTAHGSCGQRTTTGGQQKRKEEKKRKEKKRKGKGKGKGRASENSTEMEQTDPSSSHAESCNAQRLPSLRMAARASSELSSTEPLRVNPSTTRLSSMTSSCWRTCSGNTRPSSGSQRA